MPCDCQHPRPFVLRDAHGAITVPFDRPAWKPLVAIGVALVGMTTFGVLAIRRPKRLRRRR